MTMAFSACETNMSAPDKAAPILLFTGSGTSSGDVSALETLLTGERLDYVTVSSAQLTG